MVFFGIKMVGRNLDLSVISREVERGVVQSECFNHDKSPCLCPDWWGCFICVSRLCHGVARNVQTACSAPCFVLIKQRVQLCGRGFALFGQRIQSCIKDSRSNFYDCDLKPIRKNLLETRDPSGLSLSRCAVLQASISK
ncbi:hypothetical protein Lal_00028463 [Lupinus albus]|nr:hypothetical protein Lal_00028463 [Lupinus albus]